MTSLNDRILRRARRRQDAVINEDFLDLGDLAAVNKALARLCREGHLRRLARGLYDAPRINPLLGRIAPPDLRAALRAIERRDGIIIVCNGMASANRLRLTTAVSVNNDYLTDGRSRILKIGSHIVRLRHACPRHMMFGKRPAGDVVRALYWLGRQCASNESVVRTLRHILPDQAKDDLRRARRSINDWTGQIIDRVLS